MIESPESVSAAGAPPPPGADSPVPSDAAARAAAAGRAKQGAAQEAARRDELVPSTAIENRARDRALARRTRVGASVPQSANPGTVQNPTAGMPFGGAPVVRHEPRPSPAYSQPLPYAAGPYGPPPYAPAPYAPAPYGSAPYGSAPYGSARYGPAPYGAVPYAVPQYAPPPTPLPPRVPWTRAQRRTALLSAWLGQTVMALATHFLTAFFLIVAFALLLHSGGDSSDFEADSFTAIIARWTMIDRVWATTLIGLLVGGGILVVGWLVQALWGKAAQLAKPHRSTWLAWLCTTAATGVIGLLVWPVALIGGFVLVLASDQASLTTGTMWELLFWELGVAVVLTGGVGLLFGWLFWSQARPRVDDRAIAEAEEAAARAADEVELTAVRLRGEALPGFTAAGDPGTAPR